MEEQNSNPKIELTYKGISLESRLNTEEALQDASDNYGFKENQTFDEKFYGSYGGYE
ncbi:hypothetical protein ACFLZZ_00055 [Nanoarchaeota archaeon]